MGNVAETCQKFAPPAPTSETADIARIDARFLREVAELEDDCGGPLFNDAYRARLKSIAARLAASPAPAATPPLMWGCAHGVGIAPCPTCVNQCMNTDDAAPSRPSEPTADCPTCGLDSSRTRLDFRRDIRDSESRLAAVTAERDTALAELAEWEALYPPEDFGAAPTTEPGT